MIRPLPFFLTDVLVLDPADVEEASQRPLVQTPQSPPISATAQEEEISLLLGTLQVRPLFLWLGLNYGTETLGEVVSTLDLLIKAAFFKWDWNIPF